MSGPPSDRSAGASEAPVGGCARFGTVLAGAVLVLDQATKLWALHLFDLENKGLVPVAPFVDFILVWNRGISYGLLQQDTALGRWLLIAFTAGAILFLAWWLRRAGSRLTAAALGLIIGGAVGNLIDRVSYGAVADFVSLHATLGGREFRWYIFNIADAAIVAGVIGLLYDTLVSARAAKAP